MNHKPEKITVIKSESAYQVFVDGVRVSKQDTEPTLEEVLTWVGIKFERITDKSSGSYRTFIEFEEKTKLAST